MTSSAKRAGAQFETDVLHYLREKGFDAERLAKAGSLDEGDIVFRDDADVLVVMELKVRRDKNTQLSLGSYLGEAASEADHYAAARGLADVPLPAVLIKRSNKPLDESFVVLRLKDFVGE